LDEKQQRSLVSGCHSLITTLSKLQKEGRNGIWPFVLGNCYRPGIVGDQFNGIVSNPPWMAMSKLANNPYKEELLSIAEQYGIKPTGSSHLHTELATVFFLSSVKRYLRDDAHCGLILPDSVRNGNHHEPFRTQAYINAKTPVNLLVREIWELPTKPFKNDAIVLFCQKACGVNPNEFMGRCVYPHDDDEWIEYRTIQLGNLIVWSSNPSVQKVIIKEENPMPFLQGADVLPRSLIFHKAIQQPNMSWSLQPILRKRDELTYLVSDEKKHKNFSLNVNSVDDQFIYDCYITKHIMPFFANPPAKALLPMKRKNGIYIVATEVDLETAGSGTSAAFALIFNEAGKNATQFFEKINKLNKLNWQQFINTTDDKQLILYNAHGKHVRAANIPFTKINNEKTVIEQGLYWYIADCEAEALYITALFNSYALRSIIIEFQAKGSFGERHIHKLPCEITPKFNMNNPDHLNVVRTSRKLKNRFEKGIYDSDIAQYISPSISDTKTRREKINSFLEGLPEYNEYEVACREVYRDLGYDC
jgi:hypothetical protein